jgi:hypothetical protein
MEICKYTLKLYQNALCRSTILVYETRNYLASSLDTFFSVFFNTASSAAPQMTLCQMTLGLNPGLLRLWQWHSDALTIRLDLIRTWLELILTRIGLIRHSAIDLIHTRLDLKLTRLDIIHTRLDLILTRLDINHTRLDLILTRLDLIHIRLDIILTWLDITHTRLDLILT